MAQKATFAPAAPLPAAHRVSMMVSTADSGLPGERRRTGRRNTGPLGGAVLGHGESNAPGSASDEQRTKALGDTELACPTCNGPLSAQGKDAFRCPEDHHYTAVGLALTTNIAALRAIWLAIRALEDDAASLNYMAQNYGDSLGLSAERRRAEAAAAYEAAGLLRVQAQQAQQRLDALPVAPLSLSEAGSQRAR